MYLNDPRENAIDLSKPTIWEEDNRHEARYQWGAMILDLCDMEPEEYMKSALVVNGGGSSNTPSGETSLDNFEIKTNATSSTDSEDTADSIIYTFSDTPKSDIYCVVKYEYVNDENETVTATETSVIAAGDESPVVLELSHAAKKILSTNIGLTAQDAVATACLDDFYNYTITVPKIKKNVQVISGLYKHTNPIEDLTVDNMLSSTTYSQRDYTGFRIDYSIPDTDADENPVTLDEYAYDLVLAIPANKTLAALKDDGGDNVMSTWDALDNRSTHDGVEYKFYRRCDENTLNTWTGANVAIVITIE